MTVEFPPNPSFDLDLRSRRLLKFLQDMFEKTLAAMPPAAEGQPPVKPAINCQIEFRSGPAAQGMLVPLEQDGLYVLVSKVHAKNVRGESMGTGKLVEQIFGIEEIARLQFVRDAPPEAPTLSPEPRIWTPDGSG